jgi:hypothetical protein
LTGDGPRSVPEPNDTMRKATSLPVFRAAIALFVFAASAGAQLRRDAGAALTDGEFWQIFSTMSEPGGSFSSENFVSNEVSFQYPIPTLQRTVRPDGVYLGVGPEQNFTYIANLKPRFAIIFDIRRQNAMAHLMYKAMFELSPTRADFVARLFSRPLANRVGPTARVDDLFAVATAAERSEAAFVANQKAVFSALVDKHHFVLTPGDSAGIEHLLEVFFEAGPDLNYGYRLGRPSFSSAYPSYGLLQTRTNVDSVQMAFLATEENYRVVRDMHLKNLIVPVVADFAGPSGIRAVGNYLKQHNMTVQAFYLSNVEQYLFSNGVAERFYQNVATLPTDTTSMFIRSVPPYGGGMQYAAGRMGAVSGSLRISINAGVITRMQTFDSAGYRWHRATLDSGSVNISRLYRDSIGTLTLVRTDSGRMVSSVPMPNILVPSSGGQIFSMRPGTAAGVVGAGLLGSGIASISKTIDAFKEGRASTYQDIIQMTKLDGWK